MKKEEKKNKQKIEIKRTDNKNKYSFVLVRNKEESLFQGLFFSIFLFFSIPYMGIPDKYDVYYYLMALGILIVFIVQVRRRYSKEIEKYVSSKKEKE